MTLETYLEAAGLIMLAAACAILGKVYGIDFLLNTVPAGLFGAALGFLGGSVHTQSKMAAAMQRQRTLDKQVRS